MVETNPNHYTKWSIEPITFAMKNNLPFWKGNAIKYIVRAGHKPEGDMDKEMVDLLKAKQMIDFRIAELLELKDQDADG